eukprot:43092-Prorocentrum_minimum.AAC.1
MCDYIGRSKGEERLISSRGDGGGRRGDPRAQRHRLSPARQTLAALTFASLCCLYVVHVVNNVVQGTTVIGVVLYCTVTKLQAFPGVGAVGTAPPLNTGHRFEPWRGRWRSEGW